MIDRRIPYNILRFKSRLLDLKFLQARVYMNGVDGYQQKIREAQYKAYLIIYGYLYRRIASFGRIPPHEIKDIRHEIFFFLRLGFFKHALEILDDGVYDNLYSKFLQVQRLLDRNIFLFWRRYVVKYLGCHYVNEDFVEPYYAEKIRDPILDPERIAIIKEERRRLIDLLLTAPKHCRIGKARYERIAKSFLLSLYGQHSFFRHRQIPKLKFYYDYVLYAIRKMFKDYHINIDDVHNSYYDVQVEPSFSQMLADRLGVENIYLPAHNELFNKKGETKIERSFQRYQDYERNHTRFLIPD